MLDQERDRSSSNEGSDHPGGGAPGKSTRTDRLPARPESELPPGAEPAAGAGAGASVGAHDDPYGLHLDIRTRARQEADAIKAEHEEARVNLGILVSVRAQEERKLAAAEASGESPETIAALQDEVDALTTRTDALSETVRRCRTDMDLIKNPASSEADLNDLLGRRQQAGTAPRQAERGETVAVRKPLEATDSKTDAASWSVGGAAVNQATTTETSVGAGGVSHGDRTSTSVVAGDRSTTRDRSTSRKVGWDGYTAATSDTTETTRGDLTSSEGTSTTVNVGLGGGSKTDTTTLQVGDHKIEEARTTSVTRGDGKVGVGTSRTRTDGEVDGDGNLVKGSTTTKAAEGHLIADKDGVGLGGSATTSRETQHSKSVKTGVSAACDGNVIVSVKPYNGDSEAAQGHFVVIISVNAGAKVGGSATLGNPEGARAGVSGGAHAGFHLTRQRLMTGAETQAYLDALGAVHPGDAGNGSYPELAQIAAAWKRGWSGDDAGATPEQLPEALSEGESFDYVVEGGVEGKGSLGVKTGILDVGVEGGAAKSGRIHVHTATVNGAEVYSITVDREDEVSGGGSLGVGGVSGKATHSHATSSGRGASFTIKPGEPRRASFRAALTSCTTQADVDALIANYGELLTGKTTSSGETDRDSIGVEVLGVGVELGGSAAQNRSVETDEEGKQTITDEGASSGGGSVTVAGIKIGDSKTEGITTTVDAEGHASGDLSVTESGTDLDKSLQAWDERERQSPGLATATGAAGPRPVDATEQSGMLLADGDYDTIIAQAGDAKDWNDRAVSPRHMADWAELGRRIRAAKGDKAAIGAAMKAWMGSGDHGREELLRDVVRAAHTRDGGAMYEFPDGLGGLKARYRALVFQDPAAGVTDPKLAQERYTALESLWNQLSTAREQFKDKAAFGEMLARIDDRKQQLMAIIGGDGKEQDRTRFKDLLATCQVLKGEERALFAQITEAMDDHDAIESVTLQNQLRDLYLRWDPAYGEAMSLADVWGFDRNVVLKYRPDHKRWNKAYEGEMPTKSDEEEEADLRDEQDALAMRDSIRKSSGFHHEAEAFSKAQAAGAARNKAASSLVPAVAAARNKAAMAAGWINGARARGRAVAPAAEQKAGLGFSRFAQAGEQEKVFKMVSAGDLGTENGVRVAAGKTISLYNEAAALFEAGKLLDH